MQVATAWSTLRLCFTTRPSLLPSSLTVVSSPRNRWLSPLSGDPKVSHEGGGWCRMSGREKNLQRCAVLLQKRSPQLYHQSHTTERQENKGSIPESKVPILLSVYIIIDINVFCAHAHMVPPQCHGIHLSRNNEAYCALDWSVDVFLE